MTQGERLKELRKALGLSQEEFGDKIGVVKSSISGLEKDRRSPSNQVIKSICREFNVDLDWLLTGTGDMFREIPDTLIAGIAEDYELNETSQILLKTYLDAAPESKEAIENFLIQLAKNLQKKDEN